MIKGSPWLAAKHWRLASAQVGSLCHWRGLRRRRRLRSRRSLMEAACLKGTYRRRRLLGCLPGLNDGCPVLNLGLRLRRGRVHEVLLRQLKVMHVHVMIVARHAKYRRSAKWIVHEIETVVHDEMHEVNNRNNAEQSMKPLSQFFCK